MSKGSVDKIKNEALVARAGVHQQDLDNYAKSSAERARGRPEINMALEVRINEEEKSGRFSLDHAEIPEKLKKIEELRAAISDLQKASNAKIKDIEKSYNTFNVAPLYRFTRDYGRFPAVSILNFIPNVLGRVVTSIPYAVLRAFEFPIGYVVKSSRRGAEERSSAAIVQGKQDELNTLKVQYERLKLGSDAPDTSAERFQSIDSLVKRGAGKKLLNPGPTANDEFAAELIRKMTLESSMEADKVFPTGMFTNQKKAFYNCAFGADKSPIEFDQLTPDQWMKTWDALTAIPGEFEKAGHGKFSSDKLEAKKMMMAEVGRLIAEGIWPVGVFKNDGVKPSDMDGGVPAKLAQYPELKEAVLKAQAYFNKNGPAVPEAKDPEAQKALIKEIGSDEKYNNAYTAGILKNKQAAEERAAKAEAELAEAQKNKSTDVSLFTEEEIADARADKEYTKERAKKARAEALDLFNYLNAAPETNPREKVDLPLATFNTVVADVNDMSLIEREKKYTRYAPEQIQFVHAKIDRNKASYALETLGRQLTTIKCVDPGGSLKVQYDAAMVTWKAAQERVDRFEAPWKEKDAKATRLEKLVEIIDGKKQERPLKPRPDALDAEEEKRRKIAEDLLVAPVNAWKNAVAVGAMQQGNAKWEDINLAQHQANLAFSKLAEEQVREIFMAGGIAFKVMTNKKIADNDIWPDWAELPKTQALRETHVDINKCQIAAINSLPTIRLVNVVGDILKNSFDGVDSLMNALDGQRQVINAQEIANIVISIDKKENLKWSPDRENALETILGDFSSRKKDSYGRSVAKMPSELGEIVKFMEKPTRTVKISDSVKDVTGIKLNSAERNALESELKETEEKIDGLSSEIKAVRDGVVTHLPSGMNNKEAKNYIDYLLETPGLKDLNIDRVIESLDKINYNEVDFTIHNEDAFKLRAVLSKITYAQAESLLNRANFNVNAQNSDTRKENVVRVNNFLQLLPINIQDRLHQEHLNGSYNGEPLLEPMQEAVLLRSMNNSLGIVQGEIWNDLRDAKNWVKDVLKGVEKAHKLPNSTGWLTRMFTRSKSVDDAVFVVPHDVQKLLGNAKEKSEDVNDKSKAKDGNAKDKIKDAIKMTDRLKKVAPGAGATNEF